ncbi:MAG: phosphopyruvate hydratase [Candidatus Micrarchaeia archaeon]
MAKIENIRIRKIIDSRGNPTVEADIYASDEAFGRAAAPSGASKGVSEVKDYPNGNVEAGISFFKSEAIPKLIGQEIGSIKDFDAKLHEIDGTTDFSHMGGNIAIAASLAMAKALAKAEGVTLYQYLLKNEEPVLPYPLGNIIGGGKHAINGTTMQEFLAVSFGKSYSESAFANIAVHKKVGEALKAKFPNLPLGLGDEKAWVASLADEEALEILAKATEEVSNLTGIEIKPAIDLAASSFWDGQVYKYKDKSLSTGEQIDFISGLAEKYSIKILEDPLNETDFTGFAELTKKIGHKVMIIGDDLFVTNKDLLSKGIRMSAANAVLIKPNQIGTLSDMIDTVQLAKRNNYNCVISHRSGETEDSTIAQLAVGLGIGYIKTGTIGGERTAKHNELIRIEEEISGSR